MLGCGQDVSLGGFADASAGAPANAGAPASAGAAGTPALEPNADAGAAAMEAGGTGGAAGTTPTCEEPVTDELGTFLEQPLGFARSVTGGLDGCVVHVTNLADSGPGSLREAAEKEEPAWIVFDVSGELALSSNISVTSDKTIDGRGREIVVRDHGLVLDGSSNVVIENLTFLGSNLGEENDAVLLTNNAERVWVDHCTFSNYGDGLVDITFGATDISVSWCHFFDHDMVMLIGNDAEASSDSDIRVTVYANYFHDIGSYTPRLRFGRVHLFNNLFVAWENSAVAATMEGQIRSEANVFIADDDKLALATSAGSDPLRGWIHSVDDRFENGARFEENEAERVFDPADAYAYEAAPAGEALETSIRENAGVR